MKDALLEKILKIPEETNDIEFKRVGKQDDGKSSVVANILKAVVAMANTDGGTIVLGVDDPEKSKLKGVDKVFGIEENMENFDEVMRRLASGDIVPPATVHSQQIAAPNGKTVVILSIPKATESFHHINDEVWVRLQKSNTKLTPHKLVQFAYAKGFEIAEIEPVDVNFDLLNTNYYQAWVEKNNLDSDGRGIKDVLLAKGLAKEEGGVVKPVRAAVLLFAEYPTNLMDTKCVIKIAVYRDNKEIFGDVPNMVGTPKIIQGPNDKGYRGCSGICFEITGVTGSRSPQVLVPSLNYLSG